MKVRLFLLSFVLIPILLSAAPISKNDVKILGEKAFKLKAEKFSPRSASVSLKNTDFLSENGELYAAILHFDEGFLIFAADDAVAPVLAYSFTNDIDIDNLAPALNQLLNQYKQEIFAVRRNNLPPDARAVKDWKHLTGQSYRDDETSTSVGPLLHSAWNQNKYYNYYSPYDEEAPAGYDYKTPNGCVAVAMSQIMYYYRFPTKGYGSHTNYSYYGSFYVNFGQQTYNYEAMCNTLSYYNNEVAKLIFHCGVAVDMNYGSDGSGAYSHDVPSAMSTYFGYSYASNYIHKDDYTNSNWNATLRAELDNLRPVYYSGYSEEGGHAFVCDGYQDEDYMHFNFGWGGSGNGFFVTSATSSDENVTGGYSGYQSAIINLHPRNDLYPNYCDNKVITALNGTLEDGSGNFDYQNNSNCTYVITSEAQFAVTINLLSMATQQNHDFIRFWNRHPSNDSLFLEISGTMPTQTNYVFYTDSLYITFETDESVTDAGWLLSYQSQRDNPACGVHQIYDKTGSMVVWNDQYNYRDNSNCSWNLRINNASYIKFDFNQFDLSPEDHIDFYDLTSFPTTVLETVYGSDNPTSKTFYNNKIRVNFVSDNYLNAKGFNISWSTDLTSGIEDQDYETIRVYPNPSDEELTIKLSEISDYEIEIFDLVGKNLYHNNYYNIDKATIPTKKYTNGVYLLKISTNDNVIYKNFIVKH